MQLFGGQYNEANGFAPYEQCGNGWGLCDNPELDPLPKYHFNYFGPAMSTVFVLMTGEWIDAMEPAVTVFGGSAAPFFIIAMIIGKYILFNMLIAILLNAFSDDGDGDGSGSRNGSTPNATPTALPTKSPPAALTSEAAGLPTAVLVEHNALREKWPRDYSCLIFRPSGCLRSTCRNLLAWPGFDRIIIGAIVISSICLALDTPRLDPESDLAHTLHTLDLFWTALFAFELSCKVISFGFCCGKDAYVKSAWNLLDLAIVIVSFLVLLADIFPQLRPLKTLRILRVLRPLRLVGRSPGMKVIVIALGKSIPAIADVAGVCSLPPLAACLITATHVSPSPPPSMLHAGVIMALMLVFAIIGMQMFMGELASCTNPEILDRSLCYDPLVNPPDGLAALDAPLGARRALKGGGAGAWQPGDPVLWLNPPKGSFDSFGSSIILLWIIATGDEWEAPMYIFQAAVAPGKAPMRNDYSMAAFFAILWVFIGGAFALNLFVGVVVDNFTKIKKETEESATMTAEQKQWIETMVAVGKQKPVKIPEPPHNCIRWVCFNIVTSATFDTFIIGVIIANVAMMACDYWGIEQDPQMFMYYNDAMHGFGNIYYCECVLKLCGLGCAKYFSDAWCRFDFFLVCTSLLDQFAAELLASVLPLPPMLLRVLRILRILRILRLLKGAKEVRKLLTTMILSFPALVNVGGMLALVVFIYAVLGMNLFTFVVHQDSMDAQRNFDTLGSAMLLLFQCLTGDNWSGMMVDAMVGPESGLCTLEDGNCGSHGAIPYFISFILIGAFIFLNLVVAVILENFAALSSANSDYVAPGDFEAFLEAWSELDPKGESYIPARFLIELIMTTPAPLGYKGVRGMRERHALVLAIELNLPHYAGQIYFLDAVRAMIRHNYFHSLHNTEKYPELYEDGKADEMEADFDESLPPAALASPTPPDLPLGGEWMKYIQSDASASTLFEAEQRDVAHIIALQIMTTHIGRVMQWKRRAHGHGKRVDDIRETYIPVVEGVAPAPATEPAPVPGSVAARAPSSAPKLKHGAVDSNGHSNGVANGVADSSCAPGNGEKSAPSHRNHDTAAHSSRPPLPKEPKERPKKAAPGAKSPASVRDSQPPRSSQNSPPKSRRANRPAGADSSSRSTPGSAPAGVSAPPIYEWQSPPPPAAAASAEAERSAKPRTPSKQKGAQGGARSHRQPQVSQGRARGQAHSASERSVTRAPPASAGSSSHLEV